MAAASVWSKRATHWVVVRHCAPLFWRSAPHWWFQSAHQTETLLFLIATVLSYYRFDRLCGQALLSYRHHHQSRAWMKASGVATVVWCRDLHHFVHDSFALMTSHCEGVLPPDSQFSNASQYHVKVAREIAV